MIDDLRSFFPLIHEVSRLQMASNYVGVRDLLLRHPEMISSVPCSSHLIHTAALDGNTDLVALLVECGVSVNAPASSGHPERPIGPAVSAGHTATVRWLLEHGSDVNYSWWPDQAPYCGKLATAVRDGNTEIVRMLVEAGARLDVLDRVNLTPLSWAIAHGKHEIADYLRSKGAIEAHQVPGYVAPPPIDPVEDYAWGQIGPPEPLPWLPPVPVAVRASWDGNLCWLRTNGMSARPMNAPPGGERFRRAELAMQLGPKWATGNWEDYRKPELAWPVEWMLRLAAYPFENGTWLRGKYCIIANEEPPEPLSPYTEMTCWLLLSEKEPLKRAELPDGDSVVFYTVLPIHTAERDYEKQHGLVALLERFQEADVPNFLDPHRPSAV